MFLGRYVTEPEVAVYGGQFYLCRDGTTRVFSGEGYGRTECGEKGLVVRKRLESPARRWLFVGDSFVAGTNVSDSDKFTEILERKWNDRHPESQVLTLNLGRDGADLSTIAYFADRMVAEFEPERVFLRITADHLARFSTDVDVLSSLVRSGDAGQPLQRHTRRSRIGTVLNELRLSAFAGRWIQQLRGFASAKPPWVVLDAGAAPAADSGEPAVNTEVVRRQIRALDARFDERLVVIYDSVLTIEDGPEWDRPLVDQTILAALEEEVPIIDIYPPMRDAWRSYQAPTGFDNSILGEGHYNSLGHTIVADAVFNFAMRDRE